MNDDRISEVYKGEIWSEDAQERARRRINWMCRQVVGDRVLDIGTSQGIVPILLGREGITVVGVDIQQDRIEYAQEELANETPATQARVSYLVAEGSDLDFPDESFDTVVLGEVIEHLARPDRVLAEAARVLRSGGRLVLTTPFGVLHHHDHKQTFYSDDITALVGQFLGITEAEVGDRYFRVVAVKGEPDVAGVHEALRASAITAVKGIQEELADLRVQRLRVQRELDKVTAKLESTGDELDGALRRASDVEERAAEADALEQELDEARAKLTRADRMAKQQLADLEAQRRRAHRLSERRDLLEHRVAVSRWKLASMRRRRWWQLGALLGELRRDPKRFPMVVLDLLRLLRRSEPKLPRPELPGVTERKKRPGTSTSTSTSIATPLLPRRDVVAVGVVDDRVRELLDHELLFWTLDRDGWEVQVEQLSPQLVVLDDAAPLRWGEGDLAALRTWAERSGVDIVELARADDAGWLHPRLHSPVEARRDADGPAVVDLARRTVNGTEHEDEQGFVAEVKRHDVIVVREPDDQHGLARLAATSTPLVVEDPGGGSGFGIHTDGEESTSSAIAALQRSDALAARYAHADMRRAVRDHDIAELLGAETTLPPVDVMVATMRPHRLENLLDNLGRQTYPNARLFLITHGVQLDELEVRDLAEERGVALAGVWAEDGDVVLGEVFNRGFARTEAGLVAKMDDDDHYGAEYLWDLVSAKDASRAEVAGKWAHYVYLEGPGMTVYRFGDHEHSFVDVVAISTLLMDRTVLDDEQFPAMPYGSGSVFLRAIGAAGAKVYAADRWNYVYFRGTEGQRNTFPVSDLQMLAKSDVVCAGLSLDEVTA